MKWIDQQFDLQKKIVARMVELGITPVLPAFPGFVPDALTRIRPDANIIKTNDWGGFPANTSHVSFLNPLDKTYSELQKLFISKQIDAFGNVTNVYTLDQFNEVNPSSGESAYLSSISTNTYSGLTAANPAAIWMLQGWLFYSSKKFWTQERIDAYLSGPEGQASMLVLDLFSESNPQWQRTQGYAGRPWIWCELHDFGENMALEGQILNITVNPIEALATSKSMVGMGLTPEGYEGNQIVYDLLLDQAWSAKAIETQKYFKDWIAVRYAGTGAAIPDSLNQAWDLLRTTVYNSTDLGIFQVPVSVYQLSPTLSGILDRRGHSPHPTALHYDPKTLQHIWTLMHNAVETQPKLWDVPAFTFDLVDVSRQVLSNAFADEYAALLKGYNTTATPTDTLAESGDNMMDLLNGLDRILSTTERFTLRKWLSDAKRWADSIDDQTTIAFDARSQITVWGIQSYLNDYAAKAWSGLVSGYFGPRWEMLIDAVVDARRENKTVDNKQLGSDIRKFETAWQFKGWDAGPGCKTRGVQDVTQQLQKKWPKLFA